MTAQQRKRAARRSRRRRQRQIKRRLAACFGIAAAMTAVIVFASSAGTRQQDPPEATQAKTTQAVSMIAETVYAEEPEPETEAGLIQSMDWSSEEAYMLAKMAMAEAEGEDTEGKALVILVILNRVWAEQFPDTIPEVIVQRNAFTSYSNGRYDRVEPDADCWAALELVTSHWDESQGALYFERTPEPGQSTWHSRNLEKLFTHGNHTFYREVSRQ